MLVGQDLVRASDAPASNSFKMAQSVQFQKYLNRINYLVFTLRAYLSFADLHQADGIRNCVSSHCGVFDGRCVKKFKVNASIYCLHMKESDQKSKGEKPNNLTTAVYY